jgi:hypothetical protein
MTNNRGGYCLARIWDVWQVLGMSTTSNLYRGFCFPAEIINHAIWLC